MTTNPTAHANARNSRIGRNHQQWFSRRAGIVGTAAHWLRETAAALCSSTPAFSFKTARKGGASSHLSRGWADVLIARAASSLPLIPKASTARALSLVCSMMGLGAKTSRTGPARDTAPVARPRVDLARFLACSEFDGDESAQALFIQMARNALAGSGQSTHLALHSGYGQLNNGYRGEHFIINIADLLSSSLRAETCLDGQGVSIHVFTEINDERFDLVSFKRKGGDGPSEPYPDQIQATLLMRGAIKAARVLSSTVIRHDTGRRVRFVPEPVAA